MKLANHRRLFFLLFLAFASLSTVLYLSGCAAAPFLTDLESVIPIALTGVTGILSILASVDPALAPAVAILTPIATKIEADLAQVKTLQDEYKQNASEGTLADIESLITTTTGDLNSLLQVNGLPAAEAAQISATATAVNSELQALLSTLPVLASSTAGQTLTVTKPSSAADFQARVQTALAPPAA